MKHPAKPYAVVVWDDAHGSDDEKTDETIDHEPTKVQSYGWVIRSDAKGVTLAAEYFPATNSYRSLTFIPRGMVSEESPRNLSRPRRKVPSTTKDVGDAP
mgnify:CR=1 FL=1